MGQIAALFVAATVFAFGLNRLGRWLRNKGSKRR